MIIMRYCDLYSTRSLQWLYLHVYAYPVINHFTRCFWSTFSGDFPGNPGPKIIHQPEAFEKSLDPTPQNSGRKEFNLEQKMEKMEKNGKVASNAWFWGRIHA